MTPEEKNLSKINRLLNLMDDNALTREEFEKNFKLVIDLIKKFKDEHFKSISNLESDTQKKMSEIQKELSGVNLKDISSLKGEFASKIESKLSEMKNQVNEALKSIQNGIDGKDADEARVASEASKLTLEALKPLIPTIEAIEQDLPKLGLPIRDSLELLQGEERLDISAIKGWEEELKKVSKTSQPIFVGGNSGGGRIVKSYDLSSLLDGSTKTFSLPSFWRIISIQCQSYPNVMRETVHYTANATDKTITFTDEIDASTTLAKGQVLIITYAE